MNRWTITRATTTLTHAVLIVGLFWSMGETVWAQHKADG